MDMNILLMVAGAAGIALLVGLVWAVVAWRRRRRLQREFAGEYERTVERAESRREAHDELRARQERRSRLDLRDLDPEQTERFRKRWRATRAGFVDSPVGAVDRAETLIQEIMRARSYPANDFEQRAADLSVDHPEAVEHYRKGHAITERGSHGDEGRAEELRQGILHLGRVFDVLVGEREGHEKKEAA